MACIAIPGALAMEWLSVKKKGPSRGPEEGKGAVEKGQQPSGHVEQPKSLEKIISVPAKDVNETACRLDDVPTNEPTAGNNNKYTGASSGLKSA